MTEEIKNKVIIVDDLAQNNFYEGLEEKDKIDLMKAAQEDEAFYSILNKVVQSTSRKDFQELVEMEIITMTKLGKKCV